MRHQNAAQNHNINMVSKPFGNVFIYTYLGATEQIKTVGFLKQNLRADEVH
jgi:hypothetical protein